MKLYYVPGASPLAAHIVLEWTGTPYQAVSMCYDPLTCPAHLDRHAAATVPMLEHAGFTFSGDVAILGYLADLHPEAGLLGDGSPRGRAEVMRWLGFLNVDVYAAFLPIIRPSLFLADEALADALAEHARQHIRGYLEQLDAQLAGRDWLVGQRSVADPYLFVLLRWAVGEDIGLYGLCHLMRFARRMESDPAVRAAILAEEGVLV